MLVSVARPVSLARVDQPCRAAHTHTPFPDQIHSIAYTPKMAWTSIADDHISLHAGNLTAADIPKVIQTRLNTQDGHRIARLGVGHNPIGDRGTTELLQWLGAEGRKVEQPLWVRQALEEGDVSPRDEAEQSGETSTGDSERASSDAIQEHPSDEQGPGLPPVPPSSPHAYIALRHLVLEGSGIGNDGLKAIAGYVRGNGALTRLDLQGNQIGVSAGRP